MSANNAATSAISASSFMFRYTVDLMAIEAYSNGSISVIGKTVEGGVIKEGSKGVFGENILPKTIQMNMDLAKSMGMEVDGNGWSEIDFDPMVEDFLLEQGLEAKVARRTKADDGTWTALADGLADYEGGLFNVQLKLDFNGKSYLGDNKVPNIARGLDKAKSMTIYFNDLSLSNTPNVNPNTQVPTYNMYFREYVVVFSDEYSGNRIGLARFAAKHAGKVDARKKFIVAATEKATYQQAMQETKLRRGMGIVAGPSQASPNTNLGQVSNPTGLGAPQGANGTGAFRREVTPPAL